MGCFCDFYNYPLLFVLHFYVFCSFNSKYKINPLLPLSSLPDCRFSLDKLLYFSVCSFFHMLQTAVSEHRYYHILLWRFLEGCFFFLFLFFCCFFFFLIFFYLHTVMNYFIKTLLNLYTKCFSSALQGYRKLILNAVFRLSSAS